MGVIHLDLKGKLDKWGLDSSLYNDKSLNITNLVVFMVFGVNLKQRGLYENHITCQ